MCLCREAASGMSGFARVAVSLHTTDAMAAVVDGQAADDVIDRVSLK